MLSFSVIFQREEREMWIMILSKIHKLSKCGGKMSTASQCENSLFPCSKFTSEGLFHLFSVVTVFRYSVTIFKAKIPIRNNVFVIMNQTLIS